MPTKLFFRDTKASAIGVYRDLLTTAGPGDIPTGTAATTAGGTQIQFTYNAGSENLEWISGRVPSGGFTLAGSMSFSAWGLESYMSANAGFRARVFRRTAAGSETEVGGGPYDEGAELGTSISERVWSGTPTSTAFSENDRIVVRLYITNAGGTMGNGYTASLTYGAPDAATGDSFFQITENVTFKGETQPLTAALFSNTQTFYSPTVALGGATQDLTPARFDNTQSFFAPTVAPGAVALTPSLFTSNQTFYAPTVAVDGAPQTLTPELFVNSNNFFVAQVSTDANPIFWGGWAHPRLRQRDDETEAVAEVIEAVLDAQPETPMRSAMQDALIDARVKGKLDGLIEGLAARAGREQARRNAQADEDMQIVKILAALL